MKGILITGATVVALLIPGAAGAGKTQTLPIRKQADTTTKTQQARAAQAALLQKFSKEIKTLRLSTWGCQDKLGVTRTRAESKTWLLPQSVGYRAWVSHKWKGYERSCQIALEKRTFSFTDDWPTAVRRVQQIYPGTSDWLLYISHREGGWGRFVMNTQGSGAGGWMQFMASTYWAYSYDAFADAKARGFILDPSWNQWTNPIGQAVTAGYMKYTGREGCHWCL